MALSGDNLDDLAEMFGSLRREAERIADNQLELRDHFAGLAMQGMLANPRDYENCGAEDIARFAYKFADALLSAREGR